MITSEFVDKFLTATKRGTPKERKGTNPRGLLEAVSNSSVFDEFSNHPGIDAHGIFVAGYEMRVYEEAQNKAIGKAA